MILHDAYMTLKRRGLVANYAAYSADYLNKSPRYLSDLTCSRRDPSIAVLLSLFVRVKAIADAFGAVPKLAAQASEIGALAAVVWAELERRTCSLLPPRRTRHHLVGHAHAARAAERS